MRHSALRLVLVALGATACATVTSRPPKIPAPVDVHPPLILLTPREQLVKRIDSLISQHEYRTTQWGVLVVNPKTGDTLFSRNAGKLFMPASNMKIITGVAALTLLGPDYRYQTTFAARGPRHDSTLDGDLVVIGRGDPTVSDTLRGNAMNVMDALSDSLLRRGIRRVTGSLVSGGNAFPDSAHGFGWQWDYLGEYYASGVDELFFNEGMAPTILRADGKRDSLFSGPAPDPDRSYLAALDSSLVKHGILVAKGVAPKSLDSLPALDTLFVFWSLPMRQILPALLKPSQNQIAEILFKTIGLERGGRGTADSARTLIGNFLRSWGVLDDGFLIFDGSGLSRHDLVTPETIVRVLDVVQRDTAFTLFYDALPIAGVDGTIRNRMKGTPAAGNVHAKTGTLSGASSLSGYVTTADGERFIFSILCNNYLTPSRKVREIADAIAADLASYRERQP